MTKGKKYYNKETEIARQLNQQNKSKYTGKIQNRLREKIYGKEKINSEFTNDMIYNYEMESKNSVFMEFKNKHLHKFRDFYFKAKEKQKEKLDRLFNKLDEFDQFEFKSIERANEVCDIFEKNNICLLKMGYKLPYLEYYILERRDNGRVVGCFSKQYLEEVKKIESYFEYSDGDEFIDSEAEAIITKRYYDFQNNIKEEGKDGVVATRKENYNYMDKNFKIIDE